MSRPSHRRRPHAASAPAQQRLARLYADEVYYSGTKLAIMKAVQTALNPADTAVKAALEQGPVTFPAKLDPGTLEDDVKTARNSANDAFTLSENYLEDIISKTAGNEPGKTLQEAAKVAKMIEQYAHFAFATAISDPKADSYKQNESKNHGVKGR